MAAFTGIANALSRQGPRPRTNPPPAPWVRQISLTVARHSQYAPSPLPPGARQPLHPGPRPDRADSARPCCRRPWAGDLRLHLDQRYTGVRRTAAQAAPAARHPRWPPRQAAAAVVRWRPLPPAPPSRVPFHRTADVYNIYIIYIVIALPATTFEGQIRPAGGMGSPPTCNLLL